jgi:hypothetical protein
MMWGRWKLEHSLFEMPFLSTCSPDKAQERTQEVSHRTAKATANLRMQRLSKKQKNAIQLERKNRKKLACMPVQKFVKNGFY